MFGIFKSFSEMPSTDADARPEQVPAETGHTREYFAALSNEELTTQALDALAELAQRDPKITEGMLSKVVGEIRAEGARVEETV